MKLRNSLKSLSDLARFRSSYPLGGTATRLTPKKSVLRLPAHRPKPTRDGYLAIVAAFRNEARYLAEWLAFHRLAGADHVYLYDNGSNDEPEGVLGPFLADGFVTLTPWPLPWATVGSLEAHHLAYAHAILTYGHHWRWMAFIDLDEFLFSGQNDPEDGLSGLPDLLRNLERFPAVFAYWTMFGSSGHRERAEGLVTDCYRFRAPFPLLTNMKSIVDPSAVTEVVSSHFFGTPLGLGVGVNEVGQRVLAVPGRRRSAQPVSKRLKLHHYYSRSTADWEQKVRQRREHWDDEKVAKLVARHERLEAASTVEDSTMDSFLPELRRALGLT